ncbi:transcription antitermination factor NusG [Phyllobacterium sp. 1468]|uniref:transcription termination/antitermination protein NusG n=1 Tax=Phyllobacterium sp. 1468 TaxID=2817759 RepID=UPI00285A7202|nr:transcription termination/antitermination NusG family protein [Phyllobacterium sp. 1468]MDR6632364.1 transcription antitermination factor NusG [Phyllobacterium sp. 1468]
MKAGIDEHKHWYVVRTAVKGEEKAVENIRKLSYDFYLPRRRVEVKNHKTHTYSLRENPLMPRYLFVGFKPQSPDFYRVNNCDGVESILSVDGRPVRISAASIETIFLAEVDLAFDDTRAARLHRNEECRTTKETNKRRFPAGMDIFVADETNPFANFDGVVDEVTRAGRIIALIELFGRMTPVQFDARQITPKTTEPA